MNQNENTMLAVLPPAERAAVALKSTVTEQHLRELIAKTAGITNVVDKNGRDEAHAAAMMLKNARVAVVKAGKSAREDAVAFQKAVVAESDRLADITEDEEARLLKMRDEFDAKLAREKAEKERIEAERVAAIRNRIDVIGLSPTRYTSATSDEIIKALQDLALRDVYAEEFAEFADEAYAAVETAAAALIHLRDAALAREEAARQEKARQEEAARKAEESALELARLSAELAERNRIDQEEKAAREVAEAQARAAVAERDRQFAEQQAKIARHQAQMNEVLAIQNLANVTGDWGTVDAALQRAVAFQPETYGSMEPMAKFARNTAIDALNARLATLEKPAAPQPEPVSAAPIPTDETGMRSVFRDLDDPEPAITSTLIDETRAKLEANRVQHQDDARAVQLLEVAVRDLYETRSAEQIRTMVSGLLDELDAGEGK